jgi:hypothetical protein
MHLRLDIVLTCIDAMVSRKRCHVPTDKSESRVSRDDAVWNELVAIGLADLPRMFRTRVVSSIVSSCSVDCRLDRDDIP